MFSPRLAGLTFVVFGAILLSATGCKQESPTDQKSETNAAYKEVTIDVSGMT